MFLLENDRSTDRGSTIQKFHIWSCSLDSSHQEMGKITWEKQFPSIFALSGRVTAYFLSRLPSFSHLPSFSLPSSPLKPHPVLVLPPPPPPPPLPPPPIVKYNAFIVLS